MNIQLVIPFPIPTKDPSQTSQRGGKTSQTYSDFDHAHFLPQNDSNDGPKGFYSSKGDYTSSK